MTSRSEGYPLLTELTEPPYSLHSHEKWGSFNMRQTEVYCEHCKYRTITAIPAPHCGTCKLPLYVVVRHQSEHELAGRNNVPTQGT